MNKNFKFHDNEYSRVKTLSKEKENPNKEKPKYNIHPNSLPTLEKKEIEKQGRTEEKTGELRPIKERKIAHGLGTLVHPPEPEPVIDLTKKTNYQIVRDKLDTTGLDWDTLNIKYGPSIEGYLIMDVEGRCIWMNPAYTKYTSLSANDYNREIFSNFLEKNKHNTEIFYKLKNLFVVKPKFLQHSAVIFYPKLKKEVFTNCIYEAIYTKKGDLFGYFIQIDNELKEDRIKDIIKKVDVELAQANMSYCELHKRYEDKMAYVLNKDRQFLFFSKKLRELNKRDELDLMNDTTYVQEMENNSKNIFLYSLLKSFYDEKPKNFESSFYYNFNQTTDQVYLRMSWERIEDKNGEFFGYIAQMENLEDKKDENILKSDEILSKIGLSFEKLDHLYKLEYDRSFVVDADEGTIFWVNNHSKYSGFGKFLFENITSKYLQLGRENEPFGYFFSQIQEERPLEKTFKWYGLTFDRETANIEVKFKRIDSKTDQKQYYFMREICLYDRNPM